MKPLLNVVLSVFAPWLTGVARDLVRPFGFGFGRWMALKAFFERTACRMFRARCRGAEDAIGEGAQRANIGASRS